MTYTSLNLPRLDPAQIFETFRGNYATELLTAAVTHFNVFSRLAGEPLTITKLATQLGLASRPANVLVTSLRAFGLLNADDKGRLCLSDQAREYLLSKSPFSICDYIGLAAQSPGVLAMVERLRSNRPAGTNEDEAGTAFIFREGTDSAMEEEESARRLTLALAGRAKIVAPVLAEKYPLPNARCLLDVGGGTGIYSIAWLQKHPHLRAIVVDRPEVLKVASEMAATYGVSDRLECRAGDMFADDSPAGADVVLLSNVLHDWDVDDCRKLIKRCAEVLPAGGQLLVHDVFLNDALDGPLAIALYSAALFTLTEGRAYSAAEYRSWLKAAGLNPGEITPTYVHCGVLPASK